MHPFDQLTAIVKRKNKLDKAKQSQALSHSYLHEIKAEVDEVIEEIPNNRLCYLEDELADVLWDYLNAVSLLEKEQGVDLISVLIRACKKYDQRISAIEQGISWDEIKKTQKMQLAKELKDSQAKNSKTSST